jgi:TetR/AcrR family transcriptional regulator, transcriptional repressor for nem operon
MPRPTPDGGTAQKILDTAERLVQTRGFNGFSYADIAAALRVTKASLHYHFASKAELGQRLIARYEQNFLVALDMIDRTSADAGEKLRRYVKIYADVLRANRMCLCGMLAAEYATLPKPMRDEVTRFFDTNEKWLVQVLDEGRKAGDLRFSGEPRDLAELLVGSLEGGMMLARSHGDVARFEAAAERLLSELGAAARPGRPARKSRTA